MENVKIETKFEVNNEDNSIAKMYLYGTIRQAIQGDNSESVISSQRVVNALNGLKGKNIELHLNSGGGDVFESIAIRNALLAHDADVDIYIDAMAGSGASVIATAGKRVFMDKTAMQMIHKAWTVAVGNSIELRKVADDLEKIDKAVKASYMDKFVGTEEELSDLIAAESYLNADECLAFGLCTHIIDKAKEEPKVENNIKQNLFNKYNKNIVNEVTEESKKIPTVENKNLLGKFKN